MLILNSLNPLKRQF